MNLKIDPRYYRAYPIQKMIRLQTENPADVSSNKENLTGLESINIFRKAKSSFQEFRTLQ
ncbi:hypothetical protein QRD38_13285 [Leptospira weilii]|uniref:hypothetical protein n=1 Tax=Leptospira weilii TaxID=28184 RepID=UPI00256F22AC|nr:hypothetical protein [Leptospira weilii]MDL5246733.1 hypothetical protein [Leptospira weilii]